MCSGTGGCTHFTTLLLNLVEAQTSVNFLRMNQVVDHSARARADGSWTAAAVQLFP